MVGGREPTGHEPRAMQRGLQLLEAVAEIGPGATAQQIAAHASIPRATAYRLLNVLVADGYLVRIADLSGFALGVRLQQLAVSHHPNDVNISAVEQLRSSVRFGVFLTRFAGGEVVLVDRDPDFDVVGLRTMLAHPHANAAGKLALALTGAKAQNPLKRCTAATIASTTDLDRELVHIRKTGTAFEVDETRRGRSALAVRVDDAAGAAAGALVVMGRTGRIAVRDAELVDLVRHHASMIRLPAAHLHRC